MLLYYMASYSKIVILVDFILVDPVAPPHFYFMSGQDSDESRVTVFCFLPQVHTCELTLASSEL